MLQGMPIDWVTRHSAGAMRQGVRFEDLMSASLIDIRYGDNRDRISPAQHLLLCMNTAMMVEDAAHGLIRNPITPGFTAIGLSALLGSADLESAIGAVLRLYGMATPSLRVKLTVQHEHATLSVEADCESLDEAALLEDTYLAWMFMHCMYFLGRPLPVIEVVTRDRAHYCLGRPHYAIGAPVRTGAVTAMRFSRALLATRGATRPSENAHWECFRLWLDFVDNDWSLSTGAERDPAPLRLTELARRAGVSASTMRRRLQPIDGGYREGRKRVLLETAVGLLRDSDVSVEAIAAELGYADARSFRRFLKAATGRTPQELRLAGADEDADDHLVRRKLQEMGRLIAA